MKTINKITFIIALLLVMGFVLSCNQSGNKNRSANDIADSVEVMRMKNERFLEAKERMQRELDRTYKRIENLDESDPDFNRKLDLELARFQADIDSLNNRLRADGYEINREMKVQYELLRENSNDLKHKVKRWLDRTGDNLDELGNDIKRNFKEFKESLKKKD